MRIDSIGSQFASTQVQTVQPKPAASTESFGETMKKAVSDVNDLQQNADQLANKLATGDTVEVHQAMLAMQKASTALQFTVQVRNKVIEAYQEIMRMPV